MFLPSLPTGTLLFRALHIQGGTQLLDQLFLDGVSTFLATDHLENFMFEGVGTMLPDQLLQREIASLNQGVINVIGPPNVKALVKGPTTNNRDADVGIPGGKAPDEIDDMVAIGTTLAVRFPVNLATVHSLIIA